MYFLEVARYRNFTRASEAAHVTQPAISKMIKNLEDELGVKLFHRADRRLELTEAGKIVEEQAREILQSMDNMKSRLLDLAGLKRGELKVGIPPMTGSAFFPQVLAEFYEQHPLIDVRLLETGARKVESSLMSGDLDLGISVLPVDETQFVVFPFYREDVVVAMHPQDPLASQDSVALKDLKDARFILFHEEFALHSRVVEACERAGFHPNIVSESSQWDFIAAMVASNLGVALLPPTICRLLDPRRIRILPLAGAPIVWDLAIIWKRSRYLSAAAQAWMELTCRHLQNISSANRPWCPPGTILAAPAERD